MQLGDLDFDHPPEAVALRPAARREDASLLVARGAELVHDTVAGLPALFEPGDVLVLNDTWVRPARVAGRKPSGGRVEVLVVERRAAADAPLWLAMLGSARPVRDGARVELPGGCVVEVVGRERELFLLRAHGDLEDCLAVHGRPPLPPYIERELDASDLHRYQTLHAVRGSGEGARASSAAPTAGLHLTPALLAALEARGAEVLRLALGVGPGTFLPVQAPRVEDHRMHEEPFDVPAATALALCRALSEGRRVTAVGTTVVRALEAAATPSGRVRPLAARTGLFLLPGCRFRVVSRLLTNFHQPRSTLLALVQAFAGAERTRAAYAEAIAAGYRLFSYGDALLVDRAP